MEDRRTNSFVNWTHVPSRFAQLSLRPRLFLAVVQRGFQRFAAYPVATLSGIFANTLIGFLRAYVLLALYRERGSIGGYDASAAVTYVWLTQGLITTVYLWPWNDIALRVRSGDIATDLLRPISLQYYTFAFDVGRATFHAATRAIPPVLIGLAVFDLSFPGRPAIWVLFLFSTLLAVVVSFAFRFLYNLASFWVTEYRGIMQMSVLVMMFFSGFVVPVTFFPHWLESFAQFLPFQAMLQTPVNIFVEGRRGLGTASLLGLQLVWVLVLLGSGQFALRQGARKLAVQGG